MQELSLFDVVRWKRPGADEPNTWIVTLAAKSTSGMTLADWVEDLRDPSDKGSWFILSPVNAVGLVAVSLSRFRAEYVLLSRRDDNDEDIDEDSDEDYTSEAEDDED